MAWTKGETCLAALVVALSAPLSPAAAETPVACLAGTPAGLEAHGQALCASAPEDLVLHQLRAGQAAFAAGATPQAAAQFDAALAALDVGCERHSEKDKAFRGEPYERLMLHHYRGLLHLMAGEWQQARTQFRRGADEVVAPGSTSSDSAAALWLAGWASRCQGDGPAADALFGEAADLREGLRPPPATANVLVVAETGTAPRKATTGKYNELLLIREGSLGNDRLIAQLGRGRAEMVQADDLFLRATSRGGRAIDGILAEKADDKAAAEFIGNKALTAGIATTASANLYRAGHPNDPAGRAAGAIGGAVALVGLVAALSAASNDPAADTRAWDSLPHSIHLAALTPTGDLGRLDLLDGGGRSVIGDRSSLRVHADATCSLVWAGSGMLLPSRTQPAIATAAAPAEGPPTCRTSSGAMRARPAVMCSRIGGTPL